MQLPSLHCHWLLAQVWPVPQSGSQVQPAWQVVLVSQRQPAPPASSAAKAPNALTVPPRVLFHASQETAGAISTSLNAPAAAARTPMPSGPTAASTSAGSS